MEKLILIATPKGSLGKQVIPTTNPPIPKSAPAPSLADSASKHGVSKIPLVEKTKSIPKPQQQSTAPQSTSAIPSTTQPQTNDEKKSNIPQLKGPSKQELSRHQIHTDADLVDIPSSILSTTESADALSRKAAAKYGY